jgi:dipeptidyl aminopeptidase/acylaminoacyl peptidase
VVPAGYDKIAGMTGTESIPYGAWPSPITAADLATGTLALSFPGVVGQDVWWSEGRPAEAGRVTVMRAGPDQTEAVELLPEPWNARTRVHEYGGRSWHALDGGSFVFANFTDQRLYRVDPGAEPTPITPEPATPAGERYADFTRTPDGTELACVRESHGPDGTISRALVAVRLDGSAEPRVIVTDGHFLAHPRYSPDGTRLAWITWEHPRMPWDGTELRVASLDGGTAQHPVTLLGGETESVLQPEWATDDTLYAISDRTGWWNLYALQKDGSALTPLLEAEEEFGGPLWQLGITFYTVLPGGRVAIRHGTDTYRIGVLDPATGKLDDLDLPYTALSAIAGDGPLVTALAAGPTAPATVLRIDTDAGTHTVLRRATTDLPDAAYLPVPESAVVPGKGGREVHVHIYPPTHPSAQAPEGELPPYVVHVHGGPTGQSMAKLDLEVAYFTSRGIGVLDVNYGGSTGHGREYRERLNGQWGIVDVEDSVSAVLALADAGRADRGRLAIAGGSAGGWTTLAALVGTDVFACGVSYFGVAELERFAEDTHDFESRYLDGLIGKLPEERHLYVERAPLTHVDDLSCPVLLLQGADDKVVPPSQSELFRDALVRKGIPHAYLLFEGEGHGFRRAETNIAATEAELSFYGQVLGFQPVGVPTLQLS